MRHKHVIRSNDGQRTKEYKGMLALAHMFDIFGLEFLSGTPQTFLRRIERWEVKLR